MEFTTTKIRRLMVALLSAAAAPPEGKNERSEFLP
jgi:hypothetical protein